VSLQAAASWRKTLVLATREVDAAAPGAGFDLVQQLTPAVQGIAARPAGWWQRTLLAAEMVADIDRADERAPQLVQEVRAALLALIGDGAAPLAERVRGGRLLGTIGDPRFADLLSDMVMVDGGPFVLGASVAGFDDEGPPQRIDVPMFRIGVYPVTNREYARFLAANPDHPAPHYWRDPRFNNPSLPAVGVTWHDAAAYCAWLTREALSAGLIKPGVVIRLPLEAEWEKAATWGPQARRKRAFPWGDTWDAARANTAEARGAWLTTPVGCYPGGVSQYGVHDMTGNIWEWTASEYSSYPGSRQAQHQAGQLVLRGSSCVSAPVNARATYRGSHLPPHYWRYHLGFRIVVGKPLPRSDSAA
jgi:iron(II)-dependent oxidoreductase